MLKVKLIDEKLTHCPMKGKQGHCFAAQVFDSYGYNVAQIDSEHGAIKATKYAKLFAASLELLKASQSLVSDFETDFMLSDGTIVDKPSNLLLINYEIAKKAIKKAGF